MYLVYLKLISKTSGSFLALIVLAASHKAPSSTLIVLYAAFWETVEKTDKGTGGQPL
jgi:hypothetical protein